jgi:hypothetical protein
MSCETLRVVIFLQMKSMEVVGMLRYSYMPENGQ